MKTTATAALGALLAVGCGPTSTLEQQTDASTMHASAYAAAPRCGPAKISRLSDALPDTKLIGAVEIDVKHLRRGVMFADLERVMTAEASEVLDGMKECGVPLSSVDGIVVGFSDSDDVVFGAQAKGLGTGSTLDCLAKKIEGASGTSPWTRVTKGCSTTLEMTDGGGTGFAVGPDMVVFASTSLETAVGRRVEGKDKSALDGRLAWVRKEIDTSGSAWMATNLPPAAAAGLPSEVAGLERVGLGIDASKGLGLSMGAGFRSASEAKAAASELETQLLTAKMMLPMIGLPMSVADTVAIKAKGPRLTIGMFLSPSDLDALRKAIEDTTGGGSSSPPPTPPSKGI